MIFLRFCKLTLEDFCQLHVPCMRDRHLNCLLIRNAVLKVAVLHASVFIGGKKQFKVLREKGERTVTNLQCLVYFH